MSVCYVSSACLPTNWGVFHIHGFEEVDSGREHLALTLGDLQTDGAVLARVHSECLTGDALFSIRCDCGSQLQTSMEKIAEAGSGIILYLRQEGRGIGLLNKIKAYQLQDKGADTVEANEKLGFSADMRDYSMCFEMLQHFGITQLRLMTNNPRKVAALEELGFEITERLSLLTGRNPHNEEYLATKMDKLGHILNSSKTQ